MIKLTKDIERKNLFSFVFLFGFALLVLSCAKNNPMLEESTVDIPVSVQVQMLPLTDLQSKTTSPEEKINDLYLFFINNENRSLVYHTIKLTKEAGESNFKAIVHLNKTDIGVLFYCHLFANIDPFIQEKGIDSFLGDWNGDMQEKLIDSYDSSKGIQSNGMVMWGKVPFKIESGSDGEIGLNYNLIRSLARVDVSVENNVLFDLKTVHIYRSNIDYSFMPLKFRGYGNTSSVINEHSAINPNIDEEPTYFEKIVNDNKIERIYIPESDVKNQDHSKRCAIVVGGYYNNANDLSYYRIDFVDQSEGSSVGDIIRNRLYNVKIIEAKGAGYPSSLEAYNGRSNNITKSSSKSISLNSSLTTTISSTGSNLNDKQSETY